MARPDMRRRREMVAGRVGALLRICGLLTLLCLSGTAAAGKAADHGVKPWIEAVISVAAFAPATSLFQRVGQWRLTHSGDLERSELDDYGLPDTAVADFERWCAPDAATGCIRFIRFRGIAQQPIRPAARAWDTGGIFSIMIRSDDVTDVYEQALELGWWAESPPIRFQFGSSDLRNVVLKGPHGIGVAVYDRITPQFTAFPVGRMSQGFNSMRMVRDRLRAKAFYSDILGFETLFDSDSEPAGPAPSNFGIPLNLTPKIIRAATAMYPAPGETGRIEVMQIEGFTGLDHSHRAAPPSLGILSVRYPVRDLTGYRQTIEDNGAEILYYRTETFIAGIGMTDIFAVRDPDGNITEFYSHVE